MQKIHSVKRSHGVVLVRARYTEIFGPAAGTLLSQIVYWFKPGASGKVKLRIRREGCMWLAKRRQDWASECGLSPRQYDTAVSKLIAEGVVTKRIWRFHGSPTVHLHLNEAKLNHLLGDMEITSVSDSITLPVIPYTETTTETTTESEALAAAPQKPVEGVETWVVESPTLAEQKLKHEFSVEEWMATAREILKNHAEKGLTAKAVRLTANALAMVWKRRVHEVLGGFVKDLTGKELGQLKQFLQKVGEQSPDVLQYAISNWGKFVFEAKSAKGLSAGPEKPHIGFLLAHHDIAVNLMNGPVQLIAEKVAPKAKVEDATPEVPAEKATLDDVLAAMGASPVPG